MRERREGLRLKGSIWHLSLHLYNMTIWKQLQNKEKLVYWVDKIAYKINFSYSERSCLKHALKVYQKWLCISHSQAPQTTGLVRTIAPSKPSSNFWEVPSTCHLSFNFLLTEYKLLNSTDAVQILRITSDMKLDLLPARQATRSIISSRKQN